MRVTCILVCMAKRAGVRARKVPSNSLERALIVLNDISRTPEGLTNKQVSEGLGIATSSSSYLLSRLEREGFLTRDGATSRYKIGLKVLAIARGALQQLDFPTLAGPVLRQLAVYTGLDVVMGVLDRERLIVVARVANSEFIDVQVDTGTEFPAHATATGKVLLANLPRQDLMVRIQRNPLAQLTKQTITDESQLLVELGSVAACGYALCDQELTGGRRSLGAPIMNSRGSVQAALALAGDVGHPFWERPLPEIVGVLKDAAQDISRLDRYAFSSAFHYGSKRRLRMAGSR